MRRTLFLFLLALGLPDVSFGGRLLDLPASRIASEKDLDEVDDVVGPYGVSIEGDTFVWVLDRSHSMSGERLQMLKIEINRSIDELSARSRFGLIAFEEFYETWHERAERATRRNKREARAWVDGLESSGRTAIGPAGLRALEMAERAVGNRKNIIVISDGRPRDAGKALALITAENTERIAIHTILIHGQAGEAFMSSLADMNDGEYHFVAE